MQKPYARVQRIAEPSSLEEYIFSHMQQYFRAHQQGHMPTNLYERLLPIFERPLIQSALDAAEGNQLKAAEILGINRNTLRKRMRALSITVSPHA